MTDASKDVSFKLLSLLSKERGIYGLRNGDHERYRKHCSNKVHRLRQVTQQTSGKGKTFKKPPSITDAAVKDVKHLELLLFTAERALAHSHELKAARTKPNPPSSARKDQLTWLRRALKVTNNLYTIALSLASSSPGSAVTINQQTLAEITIYHLSIRSELSFERSQYAETLTDLSIRRRLLGTLADAAKDSYDQALALEFMDAYDPLIRFSAYKLGRSESHDIDGVVADIDGEMQEEALPGVEKLVEKLREEVGAKEAEKGRKMLENFEFAGDKVDMRSGEIVAVMTRVQEALGKLSGKDGENKGKSAGRGMRGWDKVLGVLGEAEAVARRLVEDHEASGATNALRSAETTRSLTLTHQYIIHLLLTHRIRRDLLLIDSLQSGSKILPVDVAVFKIPGGKVRLEEAVKSVAGVIKLYDQILQSLGQIAGLSSVQEREGVRAGVEGCESYFHATRNFHLARLHCIHPTPSYSSAIKLISRSDLLTRQARASLLESGDILEPITPISETNITDLETQVSALELAAKRALFSERVEKPVFFDTAFNYIDLPMDELLYKAGKGPKPAPAPASIAAAVSGAVAKAEETAGMVVDQVEKVVPVPERVKGLVRSTRESTPAVEKRPQAAARQEANEDEDEEMDDDERQEKGTPGKKGWLGGWFGRS